jgi:hypothetical protein
LLTATAGSDPIDPAMHLAPCGGKLETVCAAANARCPPPTTRDNMQRLAAYLFGIKASLGPDEKSFHDREARQVLNNWQVPGFHRISY